MPVAHQTDHRQSDPADAIESKPVDHLAAYGAVQEAIPWQGSTLCDGSLGACIEGDWLAMPAGSRFVHGSGLAFPRPPSRALFQVWRL